MMKPWSRDRLLAAPDGARPPAAKRLGPGGPDRSAARVVLIYPMDLLGSKQGGAETFVRGLIKHAPPDFELEFIGVTSDRKARPPRRALAVSLDGRRVLFRPLICVPNENRRGLVPVTFRFTLALLLHRSLPDRAVYVFNRIEPSVVFSGTAGPKIGFLHTDVRRQCVPGRTEISWARWPAVYSRLERWAVGSLDAVFTVSQSTLDFYRRRHPSQAGRMSFLPTCVDAATFALRSGPKCTVRRALTESCPGLPPGEPWVLFVGRLQLVKAPFRAVEGFRRFVRRNGAGVLIIVGEGNLREPLEAHVRRSGLGSRVFFLGNRPPEELARFYHASDVLLLTSYFEGLPCSVLEAQASGLPVVATDVGEIRRVVRPGRTGEIVDGRPGSIGAALARVIEHPGCYAPGRCLDAVAEFRPEKVFPAVYRKIRELAAEGPPEAHRRPSSKRS
jgi:glycosyltransferase involved in cell wall biosynthesis